MHENITQPHANHRLTYVDELVAELVEALPDREDVIRALARAADRAGYARCQEAVTALLPSK